MLKAHPSLEPTRLLVDANTLFLGKTAPQDDSSEGEDKASPPQRRKLSVPVQRRTLQAQSQNRLGRRLPPQRIVDGAEGEGGEEEEEREEDDGKDQGLHTLLLFHSLTASLFVAK